MKILVTGGTGSLGKSLRKLLKDAYFPSHSEMDITDSKKTRKVILDYNPDVVIHTAALVDIRACEKDKKRAWITNVEGTQNIVSALKELKNNCHFVYISTACVFEGENEKYYTEDDIPSPKNFYSLTKVCGEIVSRQHENSCVIRTNFAPKQEWKYPKAFTDRFGTYLFSDNVAKAIIELVHAKEKGIIHIVGSKRMSIYDLAVLAGSKNVRKMTLKEYEGPSLTVDMSLSTKRWKKYQIE
ncbi:MAG TPA: SDR family oxidoreductase [Candidatus Nanoarchaeia archaeon]|nr:SDR family oxidoreductase [Candidatus Nanoarchaeia archaeon]